MSRRRGVPGLELVSYTRDGTGSVENAYFGTARVYVKPNQPGNPFVVANEFISSRLASMVGLPVPVGEVAKDAAGEVVWASALIGLKGQEPAPPAADVVLRDEPDLAAGAFVFDVWIANDDRHDDNVIYLPSIGFWIYDHDKTLGGRLTGLPDALTPYRDVPLTTHMFKGEPLDDALVGAWVQRVRGAPATAIKRILQIGATLGLYSSSAQAGIMEFLEYRRRQLPRLVSRSRGQEDADAAGGTESASGKE